MPPRCAQRMYCATDLTAEHNPFVAVTVLILLKGELHFALIQFAVRFESGQDG
jgi:uncharacterized paraquat-inducible protein A